MRKIVKFDEKKSSGLKYETGQRFTRKLTAGGASSLLLFIGLFYRALLRFVGLFSHALLLFVGLFIRLFCCL